MLRQGQAGCHWEVSPGVSIHSHHLSIIHPQTTSREWNAFSHLMFVSLCFKVWNASCEGSLLQRWPHLPFHEFFPGKTMLKSPGLLCGRMRTSAFSPFFRLCLGYLFQWKRMWQVQRGLQLAPTKEDSMGEEFKDENSYEDKLITSSFPTVMRLLSLTVASTEIWWIKQTTKFPGTYQVLTYLTYTQDLYSW